MSNVPSENFEAIFQRDLDRLPGLNENEWVPGARRSRIRFAFADAIGLAAAALLIAVVVLTIQSERDQGAGAPTNGAPSNGWIAYSTGGQLPGSTDSGFGTDIYIVREGASPRFVAGRGDGTTRNVCPVFSPDGRRLAFGIASTQGRSVAVVGVDANGLTEFSTRIAVPGLGPAVCVRWSSDGTRLSYLDGDRVVVRGLDGSTRAAGANDPGPNGRPPSTDPLLSPAGDRTVRIETLGPECRVVLAGTGGADPHVIPLDFCPFAIASWSPDGRRFLLLEDVSGQAFTMWVVSADSPFEASRIVAFVPVNGARGWPGRGDVSWQPVFP